MSLLNKTLIDTSLDLAKLFEGAQAGDIPGIVMPLREKALADARVDQREDEIAVISHELRNSLGVVQNAARLLRLPVGTAGLEGARVLIDRHVFLMSRHIQDLIATARPSGQSNALALRLAHVDLRTIVGFAVDAIAPDLTRRGHRLAVTIPQDALWVHADGARLEQVFSNLLINAAKYTPDGGDIELVLERLAQDASIRIRDSGLGIAPALLARVFDMYVQSDATAICAEGGRGIGLAVVRNFIELHGGSVSAASAGLGLGCEFTVLLPAPWGQSGKESLVPGAR
jgi:signal transduction histidine kinase